jgi:putative oligomerization/nucleic acid binding protein
VMVAHRNVLWVLTFIGLFSVIFGSGLYAVVEDTWATFDTLVPFALAVVLVGGWAAADAGPVWLLPVAGAFLVGAGIRAKVVIDKRTPERARVLEKVAARTRLREQGVDADGRVVHVSGSQLRYAADETQPYEVRIEYRRIDGEMADVTHREWCFKSARPCVGAPAWIRYVPDDPSNATVTLPDDDRDAVPSSPSTAAELTELVGLYEAGALTDEEFAAAKARVLYG